MSKEQYSGSVQEVSDSFKDRYPFVVEATETAVTRRNTEVFEDTSCFVVIWQSKEPVDATHVCSRKTVTYAEEY